MVLTFTFSNSSILNTLSIQADNFSFHRHNARGVRALGLLSICISFIIENPLSLGVRWNFYGASVTGLGFSFCLFALERVSLYYLITLLVAGFKFASDFYFFSFLTVFTEYGHLSALSD